jgi:glycosyltransferase involved in cell wall biosynthesis
MVTFTAVVAAYNAEPWIGEALEAILGQTRPPEEVVVVDDGSTDGTARVLEGFGDAIRVVRRRNGGCPAAFNTAFREARGDFVAMCGADDIWEPRKLEWQAETLAAHPEVDVLFGDARVIGEHRPAGLASERLDNDLYTEGVPAGVLDGGMLRDRLYRGNFICAPSIAIRRRLFEQLGPFIEDYGADDYEYWMRCLRAGAKFFYDPRPLLSYRRHENNLSSKLLWMAQCSHDVHRRYANFIEDRSLAREILADDLFRIARCLVDEDRPREASAAFRASLRHRLDPRALTWIAILALPPALREHTGSRFVDLSRALAQQG